VVLPFGLLFFAAVLEAANSEPPSTAAAPAKLTPASLVLLWHHQAQFAGYYMAQEKGFYRKEGLDLTIRRGGPDVVSCDEVVQGRADFCVATLSTALARRTQGQPLVLLAQIINRSNLALVAWKHPPSDPTATVKQLSNLNGLRVSLWGGDLRLPFQAFFAAQGIQPEIVPQYYVPSLFFRHGVDVCAAMHYNEFDQLMQQGVSLDDIVVFNLWEHDFVLPEDGLYALERTWRERPDLCRGFARASLEGWRYARAHEAETLDVVMRFVDSENLPTNRPHMRWMLREVLRSIFPEPGDAWSFGQLKPYAHDRAVQLLQRREQRRSAPVFNEFAIPEARHEAP
jgi:NitT/TauT family transport system substrate-binding protein